MLRILILFAGAIFFGLVVGFGFGTDYGFKKATNTPRRKKAPTV